MTEGFIDTAIAYDIIHALGRAKPEDSFDMQWTQAVRTTAILISARHIKLAPSPKDETGASGPYGVFLDALKDTVTRAKLPPDHGSMTLQETKRWAAHNNKLLRNTMQTFMPAAYSKSTNEAPLWLEACVHDAWQDHVQRHGALFDQDFYQQIARILDLPEKEVLLLWQRSTEFEFIDSLISRKYDDEEFTHVRNAYVASALIRGKFHELAATKAGMQLVCHPVREPIFKRVSPTRNISIEISNTEIIMATIIVGSAFAEKDHKSRVALWANNLKIIRQARDQINFDEKDSEDIATRTAIDAAKKHGLQLHSHGFERAVAVTLELGIGGITCYFVPWALPVIGPVASTLVRDTNANKMVSQKLVSYKLKQLSGLVPGRLKGRPVGNKTVKNQRS